MSDVVVQRFESKVVVETGLDDSPRPKMRVTVEEFDLSASALYALLTDLRTVETKRAARAAKNAGVTVPESDTP